jgi:hypothetical protein
MPMPEGTATCCRGRGKRQADKIEREFRDWKRDGRGGLECYINKQLEMEWNGMSMGGGILNKNIKNATQQFTGFY